jgi:hypothetical protein
MLLSHLLVARANVPTRTLLRECQATHLVKTLKLAQQLSAASLTLALNPVVATPAIPLPRPITLLAATGARSLADRLLDQIGHILAGVGSEQVRFPNHLFRKAAGLLLVCPRSVHISLWRAESVRWSVGSIASRHLRRWIWRHISGYIVRCATKSRIYGGLPLAFSLARNVDQQRSELVQYLAGKMAVMRSIFHIAHAAPRWRFRALNSSLKSANPSAG